jgi:excisionase family DNA binding protein
MVVSDDDPVVVTFVCPSALVEAVAVRAAEIVLTQLSDEPTTKAASPHMTIPEAAQYLRCGRQRIDNLLSTRRLSRIKDGRRTLIDRSEVEKYLVRTPRRGDK